MAGEVTKQETKEETTGKVWTRGSQAWQQRWREAEETLWGAWVAQSVKHSTWAQVMISQFVSSKSQVGLCADSSEPGACFGFCVALSLCVSPTPTVHALSLSLKNK